MKNLIASLLLAAAGPLALAQGAPVAVEGAWARPTVAGQGAGGAYMKLIAREPVALVGATSPGAGIIEIHEMRMEGDVMKMRALPALPLAPGQPVELKPGGLHFMLMDLKAPLKEGTRIPLSLEFKGADGRTSRLDVSVPVQVQAGAAPARKH